METLATIKNLMSNSELFLSLTGAASVSYVLYTIRAVPRQIFNFFDRFFFTQVVVRSDNEAFYWISEWLSDLPNMKDARSLRLVRGIDTFRGERSYGISEEENKRSDKFSLTLGENAVLFFIRRGRLFFISRYMLEKTQERPYDEIKIRILGRSHAPINEIVEAAMVASARENKQKIYFNSGDYWDAPKKTDKRGLETIFIPEKDKAKILDVADNFIKSKDWYEKLGIPWHVGFLFYGIPGSGKTSMIRALSNHLRMDIYYLSLSSIRNDSDLISLATSIRPQSIVVIEDIDGAVAAEERIEEDNQSAEKHDNEIAKFGKFKVVKRSNADGGATITGLLNLIDGMSSPYGAMFIATTNYPEKIDAALKRGGRLEHHIEFGYMKAPEIVSMYRAFVGKNPDQEDVKAAERLNLTPSNFQKLLLNKKESALSEFIKSQDLK